MYKPNFQITPKILNNISKISEIKSIIDRSRVLPLNEAQLKRQAIIRMAHTSTSIEGNKLAEFQVKKVLEGEKILSDEKSIMEVKNYSLALAFIEKLAIQKSPLSLEKILEIHAVLMKGLLENKKVGKFRPGSVYIVDDLGDGREKLRFEGPQATKIPYLLNSLISWLGSEDSQEIHAILRAGIFHTQFVHIHPFSDGNGRITRLLTVMLLYREEWDFRKIIVLEDYYNRDRQTYYNGLAEGWKDKYSEGSDITPWLEYFTNGLLVEAEKVAESIAAIGLSSVAKKDELVFLDKDEIQIVDFVTTTGKLISDDVVAILGVAKRTAQLKLKRLVEKGLLKLEGSGPATFYTLSR